MRFPRGVRLTDTKKEGGAGQRTKEETENSFTDRVSMWEDEKVLELGNDKIARQGEYS